jgi:hypothetical protein
LPGIAIGKLFHYFVYSRMMTRFTVGVVLLGWAVCVAYPLGLLLAATPADFASLWAAFGPIPYTKLVWYPQPVAVAQVQQLCWLLGGVLLGLVGLGLTLLRADWEHRSQVGNEIAAGGRRIWRAWGRLPAGRRRGVLAGFLALLGLRLFMSVVLAPEDDAYSYRLFVRHSLLLISSCYPIPNNHVLTNSISHLFYLVNPGFWWSMRLPVVLLGSVGTLGWFGLLLVRTNVRVASLAVGLFSCLQLSLFHAAQGRGYWLLFALSGLGFDSVLTLSVPSSRRQLPWLAMGLLGPLGLYAVPTFAYFLFSVYSWLIIWGFARRAWRSLAQVALLLGGTLLAAALLYSPLLLLSGSDALLHNQYVRPVADVAAYWRSLPVEIWVIEGRLTAEKHVGGVFALLALGGGTYLVRRKWQQASPQFSLSWLLPLLALWCSVSPYVLMVAQRVRAPERTLLYKSQFSFLLAALLVAQLPRQRGFTGGWWQKYWLSLLLGGWLLLQLVLLYRFNESIKAYGKPEGLAAVRFQ